MTKVVRLRAPDRRDWQRQYRLAKQRWHYQLVRLDHDDARVLRVLAKRQHISVAELIRTYIAWGLEQQHDGELDYERDQVEE
jgi:ribbon-helix-helix CopG family protein